VRLGLGACAPSSSESLASREAEQLWRSLRVHAVAAEVDVRVEWPTVAAEG